jgi:chitin disaccharide deacetylase
MPRALIVNADDFGQSPCVNRGIVEAHEKGIVTSVSLMVRWPAAQQASVYARAHPELDVGLHVDLGEWIWRDGAWHALYERVDRENATAVEHEIRRQLDMFRGLVGRAPTHLDSHQHVHRREPVRSILIRVALETRVPLRHFAPAIRYQGSFYGQGERGEPLPDLITTDALTSAIRNLPEGVTELSCHPGYADDLESTYRDERAREIVALCSEKVRREIDDQNIRLMTFLDLLVA